MRARMAIAISKTPVFLREVVLRSKPAPMLALKETATVPLLVDAGRMIDESLDIMQWALLRNDPEHWLASKNDLLIAKNDGPFKHHLDRYKYASRYDPARKQEHRDAGYVFLETLNTRLHDAPFLAGLTRGFVDIAIFPFVRQFRIADKGHFDNAPLPYLHRWLAALCAAPLFAAVMEKYPPWKDGEDAPVFPAMAQ